MFLGEYQPRVDPKRRLYLPKKIREQVGSSQVVLSRGFENCIFGWPLSQWEKANQINLERPITDSAARATRRYLFSGALICEIDSLGRILIPEHLSIHSNLTEQATLIGAGDHFEIWDKSSWENYLKGLSSS